MILRAPLLSHGDVSAEPAHASGFHFSAPAEHPTLSSNKQYQFGMPSTGNAAVSNPPQFIPTPSPSIARTPWIWEGRQPSGVIKLLIYPVTGLALQQEVAAHVGVDTELVRAEVEYLLQQMQDKLQRLSILLSVEKARDLQ
ncbi:hypothetical protein GQ53DRAFT_846934 [Thozetella sp. PMI_491]|nr:hypothetical protein GQ53DRAFT_846934 [Thozetella sp. PMI_491]